MKLFSRNKGQLIVYFLIFAMIVGMGWAFVMQYNMSQYNLSLRKRYITELKGECDMNMAACRVSMTDDRLSGQAGDENTDKPVIRTIAMRNIIKVLFRQFRFGAQSRMQWNEIQKKMGTYGLLEGQNSQAVVDPRDCGDVYGIYNELNLFLVKAMIHNYNFNF
jgi:hypothetical protein